MPDHGFVRVAAAVPRLRVADCAHNADRIAEWMARAEADQVAVLVFPELSLTGYSCGDLFQQTALQRAAVQALASVVDRSSGAFSGVAIVGLPLVADDQLFNVAAVLSRGRLLGLVPKSYLPNYKEFYERRWFAPAATARSREIGVAGHAAPFGVDLLFAASDRTDLILGVEICEDLWVPIPPSSVQALQGASLLVNLSASNEVIGKASYRRQLVANQSGRCIAAYAYVSCGSDESTTDVVFGGHGVIAENGVILAETQRFGRADSLLVADVDIERLRSERQRTTSFGDGRLYGLADRPVRRVPFAADPRAKLRGLKRTVEAHPFVPQASAQLRERCEEIFHTQVAGLAKRLDHIGRPPAVIGVSGGLDSTLALLVACKTADALAMPRERIGGLTMPGFGTTARTRDNAWALMRQLGVAAREVDIRAMCLEEMRALGHQPFGIDLAGHNVESFTERLQGLPPDRCQDVVFENVQARMRTSVLMNSGFVIGTGDLSELALGWCTYNGDHMSMYNPNVSIPKTLVKFLVRWAAENEFEGECRRTLLDIVATQISPELLPAAADGTVTQATEEAIGPYELHDFFLFQFLRHGSSPDKILFLAEHAKFDGTYSPPELRRWLQVFLKRFFANQFKRSCLPDGPKVGSVSESPRGDWRMPSDARPDVWIESARVNE
jgi:NAD+ synthase (glutamine-hydrolysing)